MQQQQQQQVQNQQQQLQQQQQIRPTGGTCVTRPVNAQPLLSHSPGKSCHFLFVSEKNCYLNNKLLLKAILSIVK